MHDDTSTSDPRIAAEQLAPPPTFRQRLRYLGPGLIITGSIVGSGELIATTKLGSEAGYVLLWLVILGCIVKVFVQIELGRYAISSAETALKALDRVPGPRVVVSWTLWIWLVMALAVLFQTSGIVRLVAEVLLEATEAVRPEASESAVFHLCLVVVVLSVIALLVSGRYRLVERVSIGMVFLFTVSTITAVVLLQWTKHAIQGESLVDGLGFSLTKRDGAAVNFTTAFAAFGITGVGATELIYYPYWCLEKGYARHVGPRVETQDWSERARGWLRVMKLDAWVSLVVYTVATIAFYLLGAAVLHAEKIPIDDVKDIVVVERLSTPYLDTFGTWGFELFLVGAFFVLYSTFFVSTASNARVFADAAGLFKLVRYRSPAQVRSGVRIACVVLPLLAGIMAFLLAKPVSMIIVGGVAQACMLPVLAAGALYLRYRCSDPRIAPDRVWSFFLWLSFLSMVAVGIYQFLKTIGVF